MSHSLTILFRTPTAITDQHDRIVTMLAGRPQDDDWDDVHAQMSAHLEDAGGEVQCPRKERRGDFISLSTGVSYGGGQTVSVCHMRSTAY